MSETKAQEFAASLRSLAVDGITDVSVSYGEIVAVIDADKLTDVATRLRDELSFEQLIDLCGVDYSQYGSDEWDTQGASAGGFSRGVSGSSVGRLSFGDEVSVADSDQPRFAVAYQLLSVKNNNRLRLKVYAVDNEFPVVPTVTGVWASADWPEREAFDLLGIHFEGHPDLRRLLTDYGFVGHPFRKDFPLVGNVEMRYDPQKKRVIYEAVTIEPRVLVPRVIRKTTRTDPGNDVESDDQNVSAAEG